jgi:hypothetical protein
MAIDYIIDEAEAVGSWQGKSGEGDLYYKIKTDDFWQEEDKMYLVRVQEEYQGILRHLYKEEEEIIYLK